MLGNESEDGPVRKLDLEEAITDWRICLRENHYCTEGIILHTSLSGEKLYEGLINFTKEADRKRSYRLIETFVCQGLPDDTFCMVFAVVCMMIMISHSPIRGQLDTCLHDV